MKKFLNFFSLSLIVMIIAGFASCGDDKDEPSGNDLVDRLQGTWTIDKMKIQVLGQTFEYDLDDLKDETGYNQFYDEKLTFSGNKVNGQTYKVDGDRILLPYYESEDWWMKVSFSGSNMTLYMDITYQGVAMKMWVTYTKTRADFSGQLPGSATMLDGVFKFHPAFKK